MVPPGYTLHIPEDPTLLAISFAITLVILLLQYSPLEYEVTPLRLGFFVFTVMVAYAHALALFLWFARVYEVLIQLNVR